MCCLLTLTLSQVVGWGFLSEGAFPGEHGTLLIPSRDQTPLASTGVKRENCYTVYP